MKLCKCCLDQSLGIISSRKKESKKKKKKTKKKKKRPKTGQREVTTVFPSVCFLVVDWSHLESRTWSMSALKMMASTPAVLRSARLETPSSLFPSTTKLKTLVHGEKKEENRRLDTHTSFFWNLDVIVFFLLLLSFFKKKNFQREIKREMADSGD